MAKFDQTGSKLWSTYYGGNGNEYFGGCGIDKYDNIYLSGATSSTNSISIATPGSYQTIHGGDYDAYLSCFDRNGQRLWGTYMGGIGYDQSRSCSIDTLGYVYLTGSSHELTAASIVVTPATHQTTHGGGGGDGYLIKFQNCFVPAPNDITPSQNLAICAQNNTTLMVNGQGTVKWYNALVGGNYLGGGNAYITPNLTVSTIFYASDSTCAVSNARTPINVTVNPLPVILVSSTDSLLCINQSATLSATGATSYTWNPGGQGSAIIINPTVTTTYTVNGQDANNCFNSSVIAQIVVSCAGVQNPIIVSNEISFYPNPNNGSLFINSNSNCSLQILNPLGSLVLSREITRGTNEIDLSLLSSGIYFVKVDSLIFKVIKE